MQSLNRRTLLTLASGTAAVVTGASIGLVTRGPAKEASEHYTFRAVAGLPVQPLPSYASLILEGNLDLAQRKGTIRQEVRAGGPQAPSTIALPGMSRLIQVEDVRESGGLFQIRGRITDPITGIPEPSQEISIQVDRARGEVRTQFVSAPVVMQLAT
ncbi:MAG TPA: hypothetical protein VFZ25_22070 [Chloroflexota bacterium]|nr:hypothetical protein [Chloroflexota bacterium]